MTINGPTANRVTISGNNLVRVFNINSGATFEVNNLTIANDLVGGAAGGGILNNGTLTMTNCTLSNNRAIGDSGGGIVNFGTAGNSVTLNNSTLSGNTAGSVGGGISTTGNPTTLSNSTVSGNSATTSGGGLNSINGGIATLNNSIIANSTSGGDCTIAAGGGVNATYSLIEDNLTCVNGANSNNLTGDPNLGVLGNNDGSTLTHALLAGSIAIDAGNSALTTDQRGSTRPVNDPNSPNGTGNLADIGAFEVQASTAAGV